MVGDVPCQRWSSAKTVSWRFRRSRLRRSLLMQVHPRWLGFQGKEPWNWERERLWRQNLWRQKSKSQWICTNSWWTKGPIWTQGHKLWVLRILGRSRSCPSCRIRLGPWWCKWIGRLGLELPRRRFRHKHSMDWALVLVGPWIVHWVYYYTLPGIKGSSNMQYQITQNLCLGTRT